MSIQSFDPGSQGNQGPFLNWHARGTDDGDIPAKSFSLRDADGNREVFKGFKRGVAFDLDSLKTGWSYTAGVAGVAPEWKWNRSVEQFEPKPDENQEWKRGFEITVALSKDETAVWQQASAGAFQSLVDLMSDIIDQQGENPNKTPIVAVTGTEAINFKKGSTAKPTLSIKKWADKPDILKNGNASFDSGSDAPEAPPADDDIDEF